MHNPVKNDRLGERLGPVWLVGSGPMAVDYAKVLRALEADFLVVGRGEASARAFTEATGVSVITGGVEAALAASGKPPVAAIVAVGVESLASVARSIVAAGVPRVLLEKPAGLTAEQIRDLGGFCKARGAGVNVAYNRRFYASVLEAERRIALDGGVTSFLFEFTEWSHRIGPSAVSADVKRNWLLANSSHVLDLAFFLGGKPKELSAFRAGRIEWHPDGSCYAGAGVTGNAALFSYSANWESAGRWGVELLTSKNRYILRPLEKLQCQERGTVDAVELAIDDSFDQQFKPGLFKTTEAFLAASPELRRLPTLDSQVEMLEIYERIRGGEH